ncbi:MAG: beta-propeller domain-containing protein [Gammaproteobacteria bacterium]
MKTKISIVAASFCLAMTLAGCGGSGDGGPSSPPPPTTGLLKTPLSQLELRQRASCAALKSFTSQSIADSIVNGGYTLCPQCAVGLAGGAAVINTLAPEGFDDITGTNNQESGVDELDRVEADARGFLYALDGSYLVVADATPPAGLNEIANLKLSDEAVAVEGMVLDEQNQRLVIVLSRLSPFEPLALSFAPQPYYEPATELLFVDVSNPAAPVVDDGLILEGYELALRRIGSRAHLVSHFTPLIPEVVLTDTELNDLQEQLVDIDAGGPGDRATVEADIRARVATLIAATDGSDYAPALWRQDAGGAYVKVAQPGCGNVAIPDVSMPFALTTVMSVNTNGDNPELMSVANNSWNIYASDQSLFLLQTSGGWWWSDRQAQQTVIYKIAIGTGAPQYRALGMVDGWATSSFQLSEHQGFLRVATNRSEFDPGLGRQFQDNHLFVLQDDGVGRLEVVGSVREFAEGERIFSARFLGERGFVVTFRQIDPLFTFDLSNPRDPRLMGELEIPGVSTYVHPLDADHLLTIGFDGNTTGGLNGQMRLQIFDVQDLADPRLLHSLVPEFSADGFAWSSALYDHLAFNYFPAAEALTIPVQYSADDLADHFSGFVTFAVDLQTGFEELGRMDHSDLARGEYCPAPATGGSTTICDDGIYLEAANPSRAIGATFGGLDYVYTVSDVGIKAALIADASTAVAVMPLPYANNYWWWARPAF